MSIKNRLQEEIKSAMRAKNQARLGTLRLIHAAIRQREIDERIDLNDEQLLALLDKMMKQRRDSVTQYQEGGRMDLVEKEKDEMNIIQAFLPTPLTDKEITALIQQAIKDAGAVDIKDMGKVMGFVKPTLQGRADMGVVSQKIKELLK